MKESLDKREQSSAKLIEDAFISLLEKRKYDLIPISLICKTAAISRNTFYRIFESKEDLLEYIIGNKI